MNPVREAIYNLLAADAPLQALIGNRIYWRRYDRKPPATYPLVIYQKQIGMREYTFGGEPLKNEVYSVRGVGFPDDAEDVDSRCQEILSDAAITVSGRILLLKPLAEDDITFGEETDGEVYDHVGTNYRIMTE